METPQHVFPLRQAHPLPATPALAQGPPSPPASSTPQMLDSPGEAHVMINLSNTPEIVVIGSENEGHPEE